MSRKLLKELGIPLPLLPTTSVGSFPKPDYLTKARTDLKRGRINEKELTALEGRATKEWIDFQEQIGIDILVDGEMYRGDMVAYFAEHIPGFDPGGLVRSYGNRFYYKPIIKGKLTYPGPITVEWWKRAQSLTQKPVKGMLTGPYTIMDWSFNEYYDDRASATLALAELIREEVRELIAAGCKIIQVDEPAISVRPEELEIARLGLEKVTSGQNAYFITHICYGAFEKIYPAMLNLPVHNFDLEMSNSDLDMLEAFRRHPFTKDITFGVVDVHSHLIEDAGMIKSRILKALEYLPKDAVWIDPDCGLKTRS
ncbi:MAG TPA: methionine synthase, partial [candidate division Zixibacteria bacterium]|nr:methionine synthase [candidate division Zixibacteria bacterium]